MNQKMLVTLPETLYKRWCSAVPNKHRSQRIVQLIEEELEKEDEALYKAALALEKSPALAQEMKEWEEAYGEDGLEGLEYVEEPKVKTQAGKA